MPAIDDMAINERRAAAGDDVIAFGLIVMRNGARMVWAAPLALPAPAAGAGGGFRVEAR